ncbi:DNA primase [Clostridiales Family XIII bacterium PM5-7]
MGFSNSSLENLKSQINIVDVVGRVVSLKRAGSNYKGVCPFHNEKTPSFVVSEQKQIFTCFGCGATGDSIEFVKRHYNLDFSEAVEKIAGEYGITLEKNNTSDNRNQYYEVNKLAANFFYQGFTQRANKGYGYMKQRGISDSVLKKFGIGYADESWDSLYQFLLSKNVDKKIMLELGLIAESKGKCYDKFRNRVIFPIINTNGKVIGFGGRAIDPNDNPKYLNSPESKVFQKKNNLYGLNLGRQSVGKEGFIILVEGYMDTIALYQSGIENVSASLGTALTENQAKLIKRYTKNVILSYDADGAGRTAALRGLDILKKEDCKVKVLHVTDGKDPDDYIKKNGKNAFLKLVKEALPYGDYKLEQAKAGYDLSKDEDKIDYIQKATNIISQLRPVEQEVYIKKVSKDINVSEAAIRMELLGENHIAVNHPSPMKEEPQEIAAEVTSLEKTLLKLLFMENTYLEKIDEHPGILSGEFATKVYSLAKEAYKQEQNIDINRIMDNLNPDDSNQLQEIIDHVVIGGNEEQVFDDCIHTWTDNRLAKEETMLITLLSLADEENNQDKIIELTDMLVKVQRERKNHK